MFLKNILLSSFVILLTSGCSAKALNPEAASVIITNKFPPQDACIAKGDVIGSQGNWATGDFTSNKNLLLGARNDIKNQAYTREANVVVMQTSQDHQAWGSLGTTAYTMIGQAFKCDDTSWSAQSKNN